MHTRYACDIDTYPQLDTDGLRDRFLFEGLFQPGSITLNYCETERAVLGGAVPTDKALELQVGAELAADFFCQRRELGILSIGGAGSVTVDGTSFQMDKLDCLYVGRGAKAISFQSAAAKEPARFYLISYPAHTTYPTVHAKRSDAQPVHLGSSKESNERTIYKYIHPDGVQSCQLMLGVTLLEPGSVWNTMPCHLHERRTEIYFYFDLQTDAAVFHFMGRPEETRHLVVRESEAVISPMWSMHAGCGTGAYTFCWAMGGENQAFTDMDMVPSAALR